MRLRVSCGAPRARTKRAVAGTTPIQSSDRVTPYLILICDEVRNEVIPAYMGLIKQIDDQMGVLFTGLALFLVHRPPAIESGDTETRRMKRHTQRRHQVLRDQLEIHGPIMKPRMTASRSIAPTTLCAIPRRTCKARNSPNTASAPADAVSRICARRPFH